MGWNALARLFVPGRGCAHPLVLERVGAGFWNETHFWNGPASPTAPSASHLRHFTRCVAINPSTDPCDAASDGTPCVGASERMARHTRRATRPAAAPGLPLVGDRFLGGPASRRRQVQAQGRGAPGHRERRGHRQQPRDPPVRSVARLPAPLSRPSPGEHASSWCPTSVGLERRKRALTGGGPRF